MMDEAKLKQFMEYLKWYIESVEIDTEEYEAANTVLDDLETGMQFVLQEKEVPAR